MTNEQTVNHNRNLCGRPDVPNDTPREVVEQNPAHCLCCGSEMQIVELSGLGMQQAGMYRLVCPDCPGRWRELKPCISMNKDTRICEDPGNVIEVECVVWDPVENVICGGYQPDE